jgi:hypothetical protein
MGERSRPVKVTRKYDASGRKAKAQAQHDQIVAIAEQSFLQQGYAGTTVKTIADAAGVSVDTIYKTFGGKPGLVRAIRLNDAPTNSTTSISTGARSSAPGGHSPPKSHPASHPYCFWCATPVSTIPSWDRYCKRWTPSASNEWPSMPPASPPRDTSAAASTSAQQQTSSGSTAPLSSTSFSLYGKVGPSTTTPAS